MPTFIDHRTFEGRYIQAIHLVFRRVKRPSFATARRLRDILVYQLAALGLTSSQVALILGASVTSRQIRTRVERDELNPRSWQSLARDLRIEARILQQIGRGHPGFKDTVIRIHVILCLQLSSLGADPEDTARILRPLSSCRVRHRFSELPEDIRGGIREAVLPLPADQILEVPSLTHRRGRARKALITVSDDSGSNGTSEPQHCR